MYWFFSSYDCPVLFKKQYFKNNKTITADIYKEIQCKYLQTMHIS